MVQPMVKKSVSWWADLRGPGNIELPLPVIERINWYDHQVQQHRIGFYSSEVGALVVSASIPASAAAGASTTVTGVLGAVVVLAVGLRQLFQWGEGWMRASSSLIALQGEVARWSCGVPPYDIPTSAAAVLTDKVEKIVASETVKWSRARRTAHSYKNDAQP